MNPEWEARGRQAQGHRSRDPEWEPSRRQLGDECKLIMSYGPKYPEWETSEGHKQKTSGRQAGNKSCGPTHPDGETSGRKV